MSDAYKLPIKCPKCGASKHLRLVVDGSDLRMIICIDCQTLDEEINEDDILKALSAITEYSYDNNGIDHKTLTDIIHEKLDLPEGEEEEDDEVE